MTADCPSFNPIVGTGGVTVSSLDDSLIVPNAKNQAIFADARKKTIEGIKDENLRDKALDFLLFLEVSVAREHIVSELPRIVTDFRFEEAYYEWVFSTFSLGFVIHPRDSESGWFMVSDDDPIAKGFKSPMDASLLSVAKIIKAKV